MNESSGAEAFVRMLEMHGVKHIFGLCGDTTPALRGALGAAVAHGGTALVHVITHPLHEARAPVSEWVA